MFHFILIRKKIFLFLIFLFSCEGDGKKDQLLWINQYKIAKKNKDCSVLQELYNHRSFSLRNVVRVYKYRYCLDLDDDHFQWDQFEPWLKRKALQAWFHRSSKNKNTEDFIQAARQMSRISPDYGDQVRYLLHAVTVAKQNHSPKTNDLIQELYAISPSRNPKASDKLAVAYDYKRRKLFHQSIKRFRKILNSKNTTPNVKQECYLNLQKLYKLTKNKKKHLKAVRQYGVFLNRHKNMKISDEYFSNQIKLAKSHWNDHDTNKALHILHQMESNYNDQAPLDQIYWLKGKIFEETSEHEQAIQYFNKAVQKVMNKNSEFYEQLVWDLVWNLRALKMYKESIDLLTKFEESRPNISSQFIFWKAHILEEMGLKTQADEYYKELIHSVPFDYHGLMAHYKMNHPLSLNLVFEKSSNDNPYQLMGDLISADEKDLALRFMEYKIKKYDEKEMSLDQKEVFQLLFYSAQAGFYLPLFQFIGKMPPEEKSQFMKKYAYVLFPKMYETEVKKAETFFNTPASIIYSIIRQESAFNKKALSPANAVGLMQVLPRLARKVAKEEGISFKKFYDLYNPEKNIFIGTAHLHQLFKDYGGYFILSAAIYNAGQEPVKNWMQRLPTNNPVEFIQNIPYGETRTYVRLIIRNFIFYELLNHPDHKIIFPHWILNLPKNSQNASIEETVL